MKFAAFVLVLVTSFVVHGTSAAAAKDDPRYEKRSQRRSHDFTVPVDAKEIKILAYNVENLFDAEHDEGKQDWEYLPVNSPHKKNCESQGNYKKQCYETDWTAERVALKLTQIKRALEAQGTLPDVLAVEEIENSNVVGMLAKELGYAKYVVSNSPDERGIDCAILYNEDKLTFLSSAEKEIVEKDLKTRNLLVANFAIKGAAAEILGVYANHWPSQGKAPAARMAAANALKAFVEDQATKKGTEKAKYHAILMGDFNIIDSDRPNAIHEVVTNNSWKRRFHDAHFVFESMNTRDKVKMPQGTYFYGSEGVWNRLDHFFVSGSLMDQAGLELVPDSFRIIAPEFMTHPWEFNAISHHQYASVIFGIPKPYNHNTSNADEAGFSDHFPIVIKLKLN